MEHLRRKQLRTDPIEQFHAWYEEAEKLAVNFPSAVCLSTVTPEGYPDGRIVLLRGYGQEGFDFYTNQRSVKGRSLAKHPKAAMTFYWDSLLRQVRIQGDIAILTADQTDHYYSERPRGSKIGAWASLQSEPLDSREMLENRVREYEEMFADREVPRPEHWGGYRLLPQRIEFWQNGEFRLHDRFEYSKTPEGAWILQRLYP